jgi:O-antigen/teichoic acid export membrane protein
VTLPDPPSLARKTVGRFSLFFLPSVFSAGLSFLMLPLVTGVAGPHEYGVFALVNAYTAFGTALATLGGNYIVSRRFPDASTKERRGIVSTVLVLALATVSAYGLLLMGVWPLLPGTEYAPVSCLVVAVIAMVVGQPWIGALDIVTVRGEARTFAAVAIFQALATSAALLIGLYQLRLGLMAFFVSQLTGALVSVGGAYVALRGFVQWRLDVAVLRELRSLGLLSAVGNVAESVQTAVERTALSARVGVTQLGIYSNSVSYRVFASTPIGAIAKSVWPATLAEASDTTSHFGRTKAAWDIGYIGLTAAGIFFATLGDLVIGALTHGKFTAAYAFATFWMVYLLLQNSGKPQTGILFRLGGGPTYARLVVRSTLVGIAGLLVLVPLFGMWGAAAAATVQQLFLRGSIQVAARALRPAPFQDGWAAFGIVYIALVYVVRHMVDGSPVVNAEIFLIASALLVFLARRELLLPLARATVRRTDP